MNDVCKRSELEEESMSKELRRQLDKLKRDMYGCLVIPKYIIDNRKTARSNEKKEEKESRTF